MNATFASTSTNNANDKVFQRFCQKFLLERYHFVSCIVTEGSHEAVGAFYITNTDALFLLS